MLFSIEAKVLESYRHLNLYCILEEDLVNFVILESLDIKKRKSGDTQIMT